MEDFSAFGGPLQPHNEEEDWRHSKLDWLSPRASFSGENDNVLHKVSPEKRKRGFPLEDDDSFEFANFLGTDLTSEHQMLPADELFSNGKVRPLHRASQTVGEWTELQQVRRELQRTRQELMLSIGKNELEDDFETRPWTLRSIKENPRCISMTIEDSRRPARRTCMSLTNSRCSSPSRTISLPPTTPPSPKASSKNSMKFKGFFKLKKQHAPATKEAVPSLAADVGRDSTSSSSSSSRLTITSKSFWPFSRSNSAGESKSTPTVSPPPRRSNSAGESKTTSSSLLPPRATEAKTTSSVITSAGKIQQLQSLPQVKKGLPPLPTSVNAKRSNLFLVHASCGADAVALSPQPTPLPMSCSSTPIPGSSTKSADVTVRKAHIGQSESAKRSEGDNQARSDAPSAARKSRGSASPARPARRPSNSTPAQNFARGSPGRRGGVWISPGRGHGNRGAPRTSDRNNLGSKNVVRPKEMLTRDTKGVVVTPVLNVPVCITPSLRGAKGSTKSKIFGLGNIFVKKEKAARAYTVLATPDSQSGG